MMYTIKLITTIIAGAALYFAIKAYRASQKNNSRD